MSWTTRVDQTRLIDPSRRLITISRLVHPLFDQTIRRFKNIAYNKFFNRKLETVRLNQARQ